MSDADGFPAEPGGWLPAQAPEVTDRNAFADTACVVLLAEPGMGKSEELTQWWQEVDETEEASLFLDLGGYRSDELLYRDIFESEVWMRWMAGDGKLHLFLDSLDEARLRLKVVTRLLLRGLGGTEPHRLALRIACRTADWPQAFGRSLGERYAASYAEMELLPLRRQDVRLAAETADLEPERFLNDVVQMDLVPLAVSPLTLSFLLGTAVRRGVLPPSRAEAYGQGAALLAEEPSEERRDAQDVAPTTEPGERLAIAQRTAAAVLLSGHASVWTGEVASTPDGAIRDEVLSGGRAHDLTGAAPRTFVVTPASVRETLRTALFSARSDQHELGFTHQAIAEFLAARWLDENLEPAQARTLLVDPDDPEGRLIPQLEEVAAWLASLSSGMFELVVASNPAVLLRGDLDMASDEQRGRLVAAILDAAHRLQLSHYDRRVRTNAARLSHPSLTEQLAPVIADPDYAPSARAVAIQIAAACDCTSLLDLIVATSLDPSNDHRVRLAGVRAVESLGGPEDLERLTPITTEVIPADTGEDLRGEVFDVLWPGVLSTREVLSRITPPAHEHTLGMYRSFLLRRLPDRISGADLADALRWSEAIAPSHGATDTFSELGGRIRARAWTLRDEPGVLDALAEVLLPFLEAHIPFAPDRWVDEQREEFEDENGRRRLAALVLDKTRGQEFTVDGLVHVDPHLVRRSDVAWVADELRRSIGSDAESQWASLLSALWDFSEPAVTDLVLTLRFESDVLREISDSWLGAMDLDSTVADQARRTHARWQEIYVAREVEAAGPSLETLLDGALHASETGEAGAWESVSHIISSERSGARDNAELYEDVAASPGWTGADSATRSRILAAARRYLVEVDPQAERWVLTGDRPMSWIRGPRAARLLYAAGEELPSNACLNWGVVLVAAVHSGADDKPLRALIESCFDRFSDELNGPVLALIAADIRRWGHASPLGRLGSVWNEVLEEGLVQLAMDPMVGPEAVAEIIQHGLEHSSESVQRAAELIADTGAREPSESPAFQRSVHAAAALMREAPDAGWPTLWPLIQTGPEWGKKLFLLVADFHGPRLDNRITASAQAQLFERLSVLFPPDQDPDTDAGGALTARHTVSHWRGSLVVGLARMAPTNADALVELRRLASENPEQPWLTEVFHSAERARRQATWRPPSPESIIALAVMPQRRVVQSASDLLDVVMGVLDRADARIRGEPPAAPALWTEARDRPLQEDDLSDWVAMFVREDLTGRGVIVNREVQVRRVTAGLGDRTDVHVDALAGSALIEEATPVTVVIEVKGAWNQGVRTDMETQLVGRYLTVAERQHGIFLVFWFASANWTAAEDWRKAACARIDPVALATDLDAQASTLSTGDRRVLARVIDASLG